MNAAQTFANNLGQTMTKITMTDFFHEIHSQFYPDQDISFMNYFLELTNHENEFVVHHDKLVEYGIMTSTRSNDVKSKLDQLSLVEGEDSLLRDISQQSETSRGVKTKKVYHLTPGAFKKCLMRARRYTNQPIDPVIYCDYYLLLEKIYKLYTDYERTYSEKLLSMKDDKIDKLQKTVEDQSKKMDEQSKKIDNLTSMNVEQSAEIKQLLQYGKSTTKTLHEVQDDLTETKEIVTVAKDYLVERSLTSTKNPSDESKHHYFAATTYFIGNDEIVKFVTGQKSYVYKQIDTRVTKDNHKVIIKPFYNANGIDLRYNVLEEFQKLRSVRIREINQKNKADDKEFNKEKRTEITRFNKLNPTNKRDYNQEKKKTKVIKKSDISVDFKKLSFTYKANPHMSFDEVIQIILDVNEITQSSPLQTSNDESDVDKLNI